MKRVGKQHIFQLIERIPTPVPKNQCDAPATKAEGGTSSEADVSKEQARQVQPLKDEENLLKSPSGAAIAGEKAERRGTN